VVTVRIDQPDDADERRDRTGAPRTGDALRTGHAPGTDGAPRRDGDSRAGGAASTGDSACTGDTAGTGNPPRGGDAPGAGAARARGVDGGTDAGAVRGATAERCATGQGDDASAARVERSLEYRATVAANDRAYAIDQGYARVKEIEEKTVTPAMRRIEAEDPDRTLVGLENRLKGKDRLAEKVTEAIEERGHAVGQAFGLMKDTIRYTFCYPDDRYTEGVYADCGRLEQAGFERYDRRNSWVQAEYKGINSRWQVPESGQIFEVQFHTQTSLNAKEETHWAYERLRSFPENEVEVRELHAYQREVTSKVPIPLGALEIPDYP
jgi:hypothetical protein